MDDIIVKSSSHSYPIHIGENIRFNIDQLLKNEYSSILIITDENVAKLYLDDITNSLIDKKTYKIVIPAGEQSKNIKFFYELHTEAIQFGLDRQSLIIALGGGVVGDLAGFIASTYMRGVDYIQVPTTILAHDSSVGGKVAINHELGKNLIGNFYPPRMVIYDVETLQTLSKKEIRSGYAELVKEALIADRDLFNSLLKTNLYDIGNKHLVEHLTKGIKIKATIVEQDEKEAGMRKYLNLGHTLGHALEAELGYGSLTHGEAVAIGLLFSIYVSEKFFSNKLPYQELLEWLKRNKYPMQLTNINVDSLLHKMKSDKKTENNCVQMVLLSKISEPIVKEVYDDKLHIYLESFLRELVCK